MRLELDALAVNNWAFSTTDPSSTSFNGARYYDEFFKFGNGRRGFKEKVADNERFFYSKAKYLDFSVDIGPNVFAMSNDEVRFKWESLKLFINNFAKLHNTGTAITSDT